jgi:Zn-dependent protease
MDIPFLQRILIFAIPIIFAITVHEVAHGWVASKLGDQTAKMQGRLTLNPIKHIDPIGTILVPALLVYMGGFLFGWAKPVPVDWRNLRRPKRDMAWVAVAGPASNLVMAFIWAIIYKIVLLSGPSSTGPLYALEQMCYVGIGINALLMILNLFPVPPLDGSRVMSSLLPVRYAIMYNKLEPYGLFIVLALLVTGILFNVLAPFIGAFMNLLQVIFSIPL